MKIDLIEIIPDLDGKAWRVRWTPDDTDRVNGNQQPNNLGFYYYPARKGTQYGFNKLKGHLIAKHRDEISRLTRSLQSLYKLENPYENK